jgi:hypothetical protein
MFLDRSLVAVRHSFFLSVFYISRLERNLPHNSFPLVDVPSSEEAQWQSADHGAVPKTASPWVIRLASSISVATDLTLHKKTYTLEWGKTQISMKNCICDVRPCSSVQPKFRKNIYLPSSGLNSKRSKLVPASCWVLIWLTFKPWKQKQRVLLKCPMTFFLQLDVTIQEL